MLLDSAQVSKLQIKNAHLQHYQNLVRPSLELVQQQSSTSTSAAMLKTSFDSLGSKSSTSLLPKAIVSQYNCSNALGGSKFKANNKSTKTLNGFTLNPEQSNSTLAQFPAHLI